MSKGLRYITKSAISVAIYIAREVLIAVRKCQEKQLYNMSRERLTLGTDSICQTISIHDNSADVLLVADGPLLLNLLNS